MFQLRGRTQTVGVLNALNTWRTYQSDIDSWTRTGSLHPERVPISLVIRTRETKVSREIVTHVPQLHLDIPLHPF